MSDNTRYVLRDTNKLVENRSQGTISSTVIPQQTEGRFFTLPVITLISLSFMLGTSEFIIVGILPDIATDLRVPSTTVGNLVSLFAFVYAPCTLIGSSLVSRFPRFQTDIVLTIIFMAGNALGAFASNYAMLFVSRVLIASVAGILAAMSMTYAGDLVAAQYRTKFISWIFSGFSVAAVAGVPLGTWVAHAFGWRWAFHLITVLTGLLLVTMVLTLPRHSLMNHNKLLSQFRLFADHRIQIGILIMICGAAATYAFYTYLAVIMREQIGIPAQYISAGMIVYGIGSLWGNLHSARLADRGHGVEPLSRMTPIFLAWSAALCALALASQAPIVGAILVLVLGMFMYLLNSPAQILYMDVAASSHPGSINLASSLSATSYNVGIALGSAVAGPVADYCGLTWLGPLGAVFALITAGLSLLLRGYRS